MTNAETPKLLPLHPKRLSDEEFSIEEAGFQKVLGDPLCKNSARLPTHATSPTKHRHSFPMQPSTVLAIFIFESFQPAFLLDRQRLPHPANVENEPL